MGSADTGTESCDWKAGSIVWVRRRNGSWWPGKVLGPEELSSSHLVSPRSGTPVKLLGREDASVDWYNLEKSKRVKAFRCGDFDDCIMRAEASQGMVPKKREKYARRDDAILHALKLERQLMEKKYGNLGYYANDKSSNTSDVNQELEKLPECLENGEEKQSLVEQSLPGTCQVSKRPLSPEDKSLSHQLYADNAKHENDLCGEGNISALPPRMRGLQDFGLGTASPRLELPSIAPNGSDQYVSESNAHTVPDGELTTKTLAHVTGEGLPDRRKRLLEDLAGESVDKRDEKRRPILQVLQSSVRSPMLHSSLDVGTPSTSASREDQLGVGYRTRRGRYSNLAAESDDSLNNRSLHPSQMELSPCNSNGINYHDRLDLSEGNSSGSTEDTETDSSGTDSLESETDSDVTGFSDGAASIELQPKYVGRFEAQAAHGSISSEELDELDLVDDTSFPCKTNRVPTATGVSKWQLKGKRNSRSFLKSSQDRIDWKRSGRLVYASGRGNSSDEADQIYRNDDPGMGGYGSRIQGVKRDISSWDDLAWNDPPSASGYGEESGEYFYPLYPSHRSRNGSFMLVDVDLKVNASYPRQHVPLISLMSKIDGRAIVGHPIHVEALENGSCASIHNIYSEPLDNDLALQPTWRTARRTANVRVPRPHLSPSLDSIGNVKSTQSANRNQMATSDTKIGGNAGYRANMTRKSSLHPPTDATSLRKSPKKISVSSSSQKIRTLSSLASHQKPSSEMKHTINDYRVDSVIKGEALPTAVACIPIKLVFSRLHEELVGRHQ